MEPIGSPAFRNREHRRKMQERYGYDRVRKPSLWSRLIARRKRRRGQQN